MAWSTSELADLAGTTVNTVRHYHRSGLLEQPERMSNGYKQYGARHLVRLLQIRRLRDLGVPLAQIEAVGVHDGATPSAALLAIDADLAASIERLQRARAEIRAILDGSTVTTLPPGFENVAGRMSDPDQSLVLVYSQLYDDEAMSDVKQMVEEEPLGANAEFDTLEADADEATRLRVIETLASQIAQNLRDHPWLLQPGDHLLRGPGVTQETFVATVTELYNAAQLDVLSRASILAIEGLEPDAAGGGARAAAPTSSDEPGDGA